MDIAFESSARAFVVLHALAAIVLVGASTHQAWVTVAILRGQSRARVAARYAKIVLVAYVVTMILGAIAYPAFRVYVRGLYLDTHAPWASNLFDIKEHFASLGLPLVVLAYVVSRQLEPRLVPAFAVASIGSALVVWFNVVSGLIVTLVRGV